MLTHAFLAAVLAAAGVHAVAQPQITPPPSLKHRRDIFDDARSVFNSASSGIGGAINDTKSAAACFDKVEDVLDDHAPPTAEGDLATAVNSYIADKGNMCAGTALPSSLQSSWSAYETSLVSWYSTASSAIQSAADACPSLDPQVQSGIASAYPCSTALEKAGLTAVAFDGTPTGSTTGKKDDNAAPRVTGIAVGAAAFAVGAAAVLL
jgi:hypothetical protein